jgi:hypothetical protein
MPKLMNIQMELRKCCNHPFLINGVEQNEMVPIAAYESSDACLSISTIALREEQKCTHADVPEDADGDRK